jgi:hypothetical protein
MKNFDIVIQGPVYDHTLNLIEEYKDLDFVNKIVISTWKEWEEICKEINYSNVEILINDDIEFSGQENRNKQIVSSLRGIQNCNSEFVIKTRSDMLWTKSSMYDMKDFFLKYKDCKIRRIDNKNKPLGRIFCAGIYNNFPFHPFDCMFWGYKDDLVDFFNIPLYVKNSTHSYDTQTRAETYIASFYYAKFYEEIIKMVNCPHFYLYDNSLLFVNALKKSREIGSAILKPFPKSIMKMYFYKQSFTKYYDWDLRTKQDGLWFHEHDINDKENMLNNFQFSNGEFEIVNTPQSVYDDFNSFIFASEIRVFAKLSARTFLYNKVKNIPGDIIECGVYKGSGLLTWLKLKKTFTPNLLRKVIGFDMFDQEALLETLTDDDKLKMSILFENRNFDYKNYKIILQELINNAGFTDADFELIEGDVSITSKDFVDKRPGFKIALLYLDMDIEQPTYDALNNFWEKMSVGGIVVFDEYAHHQWSESKAVDRFVKENNLELKSLHFDSPTAYIKKI